MSSARISAFLCLCLALAVLITPARADVILYKNGNVLECLIKEEVPEGYSVWMLTETGIESEFVIPKDEVQATEKKPYWGVEYKEELAKTDMQSEESVRALAAWCKANKLDTLAGKHSDLADELHNKMILEKYPEVGCTKCAGKGRLFCKTCVDKGFTTQKCAKCKGEGKIQCEKCKGEGYAPCKTCNGSGKVQIKKTSTTGGGGDRTVSVACSTCGGKGKTRCPACSAKGTVKCSDCGGSGNVKIECKTCKGKPVTVCAVCEGTGIDPKKYQALLERLEKEKQPPPVVVKKTAPDEDPEETKRRKLLALTRYINSYRVAADGSITEEFLSDRIFLYPSLPAIKGEWPELADNVKVYIIEGDEEPRDGGDGLQYYHVRAEENQKEGWVAAKHLRNEQFDFITCPACEGKGRFECPACRGEKTIEMNKKKNPCMVCNQTGNVTCRHCCGTGKIRNK